MKTRGKRKNGNLAISLCKKIEKIAAEREMSFEEAVNFLVQGVVTPRRRTRVSLCRRGGNTQAV